MKRINNHQTITLLNQPSRQDSQDPLCQNLWGGLWRRLWYWLIVLFKAYWLKTSLMKNWPATLMIGLFLSALPVNYNPHSNSHELTYRPNATWLPMAMAGQKHNLNKRNVSIVIDAETGVTLFEEGADILVYPASLTKVMTLLLLFDEIEKGRYAPTSMLKISRRAAYMPKTRLGLRAGDRISVDLAVRSIVVLSANDVAAAIAENIAGTETAFAARMTRRARSIGMKNTSFANASGLPNRAQVTTAKDMALLGRYILNQYPQYYHYFSIDSFQFRNRMIRTHNRVLSQYEGSDGFKTGFTRRSGYNLLTSAERNDRRVIAVVMGGDTAAERDTQMSYLLDQFIKNAQIYSASLNLRDFIKSNSRPQQSLKDAYLRNRVQSQKPQDRQASNNYKNIQQKKKQQTATKKVNQKKSTAAKKSNNQKAATVKKQQTQSSTKNINSNKLAEKKVSNFMNN